MVDLAALTAESRDTHEIGTRPFAIANTSGSHSPPRLPNNAKLKATMNPSYRAYCDVALAMNQRRNMSAAIQFGLVGSTPPKNAPRYRVVSVGRKFFHIVDGRTDKVKGFRRDHNAACAYARKLEQE